MRKQIFDCMSGSGSARLSALYNGVMIVATVASLVPLAFKETTAFFSALDIVTVSLFVLDYALRLVTADLYLERGRLSFVLYPVTPMALLDLLTILPSFLPLASGLKMLRLFRLVRTLKVFRAFKFLRYSKSMMIVADVIRAQISPLLTVCGLACSYVLVSALVIFNVEPDTFSSFFDAVYWATVSLTTMGYGDIYPVTTAGRIVTMLSSFVGIAVVALPAGIITAGFMDRLQEQEDHKD